MVRRLQLLVGACDTLAEWTGRLTALFAPLMVLVTCYIVVTRYVFDSGSIAVQELLIYCNALLFLCGAAYAHKHDSHVRVDVFYSTASPRAKAWINLLGTLLLLVPMAVFILLYSTHYVAASWAIREQSPDTGGLPWVYLLKSLILIMPLLLLVQGLAEFLRSLLFLSTPNARAEPGIPALEEGTL